MVDAKLFRLSATKTYYIMQDGGGVVFCFLKKIQVWN